jgi:hypothetical protein
VVGEARLAITGGSSVCYNIGNGSGGLWLSGNAKVTITGASTVLNNTSVKLSGGGLRVGMDARLIVTGGSNVCNNWAGASAGGLHLSGNSTSRLTNVTICNNTCCGNFLAGGAGLVLTGNAFVYIASAQVVGNRVTGWGAGGAVVLGEKSQLTLGAGVALAANSVARGSVGSHIATHESTSLSIDPNVLADGLPLSKCNRSVYLGRTPCLDGEYQGSGMCQCCPEYQYGFEPRSLACRPCPENAYCPGGMVVSPKPGYFH